MKLSPEIIAKISKLTAQGYPVYALAERFGVNKQTVLKVLAKRRAGAQTGVQRAQRPKRKPGSS